MVLKILEGAYALNDLDLSDGLLYRENSRPEVYVIYGRAKFWIPNSNVFNAMGFSWSSVRVVADGSLANISTIPVDGTLLREYSKPEVYVMSGGQKAWIPDPNTFAAMGFSWSSVRVVPDGSLEAIPSTRLLYNPRFLWGAATASYQVEGGITNNDWEFFTRSAPIRDRIYFITTPSSFYHDLQLELQPARDAVKFWDPAYYYNYFDIAKSLGMNCFRIGIEWARVEPQRNVWDDSAISHYQQMISAMRQKGLTPVVTLNHLTLPSWVLTPPTHFQSILSSLPPPLNKIPLGVVPQSDPYWQSLQGWENEQTVNEFIQYVSKIVTALKEQVGYWLTINEPVATYIGLGYVAAIWSPGFMLDGDRGKKVLHNLIEAHVRAYDAITAIDANAKIGFAHHMPVVAPAASGDKQAAENFDYFANDYFLNAVVNGEEDLNYLESVGGLVPQRHNTTSPNFIVHNDWKNKVDFIGLNYYRRFYVAFDPILAITSANFVGGRPINNLFLDPTQPTNPHGFLNDLGWEIYPQGLHDILVKIRNQWNKPVLITENGIPDKSDRYRAQFIVAHLQQLKRAMDDGVNVLGYIYWSLMDNFEWADNFRDEARFGLYSIDRSGRELISETKEHWSSIPGFGGKGDDTINPGQTSPSSNCVIDDVILELIDKQGNILSTTNKGQPDAVSDPFLIVGPPANGAGIVSSNEGTTNLQVQVHWWFNAGTAVRYRLHYYFRGSGCNTDGQPDFNAKETKGAQALQTIVTASGGAAVTDPSLTTAISKFGTLTPLAVRADPSTMQIAQPTKITVYAQDSCSSTPISGSVTINGQNVGNTNTPFTHTFAASDTAGTVTAIGYNPQIVSFDLYNGKLLVHVQPYPIMIGPSHTVTVNLTVSAVDSQTHTPVTGRVIIKEALTTTGKDVGPTNTPFTYTFADAVVKKPDGSIIVYPTGNVSAAGYESAGIDFGFPAST